MRRLPVSVRTPHVLKGVRRLALLVAFSASTSVALAWKPMSHVYLAQVAIEDAIRSGNVEIFEMQRQPDGSYLRISLGNFPVAQEVRSALAQYTYQFRAGVMGPDAYPDIMTGQRLIHEDNFDEDTQGASKTNPLTGNDIRIVRDHAGGTNKYLQHLWEAAEGLPEGDKKTRARAFVLGYLTHAAGDMFAHTYVNGFAGGPFELGYNGYRHLALEAYLGKRTPKLAFYDVSIDGLEEFIYDNLVDARYMHTYVDGRWQPAPMWGAYVGPNTNTSLPVQFSNLRDRLTVDVWEADGKLKSINPIRTYKKAWIEDIEDGLKRWAVYNHHIAVALMMNEDGADVQRAKRIFDEFVTDHLISMAGAPDIVGNIAGLAGEISRIISEFPLNRWIAAAQKELLEWLFKMAVGMTPSEFTSLEDRFDELLGPDSRGPAGAKRMTQSDFDQKEIGIRDSGGSLVEGMNARFDWNTFSPAFNTVQMTRLLLLKPDAVEQVLEKMDVSQSERKKVSSNVMLGFIRSIDKSEEWHSGPDNNVLYDVKDGRGVRAFDRLFVPMDPGLIKVQDAGQEGGGEAGGSGQTGKPDWSATDNWELKPDTIAREFKTYAFRYASQPSVDAPIGRKYIAVEMTIVNRGVDNRRYEVAPGSASLMGANLQEAQHSLVDVSGPGFARGRSEPLLKGEPDTFALVFLVPDSFEPRQVSLKLGSKNVSLPVRLERPVKLAHVRSAFWERSDLIWRKYQP